MSTPIRKSSIVNHERKSSVDDLISLGTEQEHPVVFDPLLDTQRQQQNPHRRLSRTSNPSTGKYENYVPPGGSSQPQFRQFLATMTDQGRQDTSQQGINTTNQQFNTTNPPIRSSDDLLTEYGLNFNSVSISSSNTQPVSNHSTFNQPFNLNGNLSAPTIPPRNVNTSFLHNSGTSFLSQSTISTLPINSSLSVLSSRQGAPQPLPSCRDILADLDPLRSGQEAAAQQGLPGSGYGAVVGGPPHLKPPSVPPRTKKQWTTFD
jgi:hypothetical protein